jgi:Fic family protein
METYHKWIWQSNSWPHFTYTLPQTTQVYHRFGQLMMVESLLQNSLSEQMIVSAYEDEAIATSLIEGEVLQRSSVRASVHKALSLQNSDELHATAQTDALVAVLIDAKKGEGTLSSERLFRWHKALFPTGQSGLRTIRTGKYRDDVDGEMKIVSGAWEKEKVHYIAPSANVLEAEMNCFLLWLNTDALIDPLIKASIAHVWFLLIHPFDDGNGRLARAISDFVLSRSSAIPSTLFSTASEINRQRREYYAQLDSVCISTECDISAWISWFVQMVDSALADALAKVEVVKIKSRFWESVRDISLNERQRKVLTKMLDVLPEKFEGGMKTAKYASIAKTSKPTAARDLKELCDYAVLESHGSGRGVYYTVKNFTL